MLCGCGNELLSPDATKIEDDPKQEYFPVVDQWLDLIDSGNIEAAYEASAPSTQRRYSEQAFARVYEAFFGSRGKVKKRALVGMSPAVKLPNGDEGNFRIVTYESELGNGEEFYEYLVLDANNERWLVKDHFFNPRQLR